MWAATWSKRTASVLCPGSWPSTISADRTRRACHQSRPDRPGRRRAIRYLGTVGGRFARPRHQDRIPRPDHVRRAARRLPGGRPRTAPWRRGPLRRRNGPGSAASQGGHHRVPAGDGGGGAADPDPGPGDHRDDRPDADGDRDRRRPDHARCPAARRPRAELRDRASRDERAPALPFASAAGCRSRCCPTPACPP